MNALELAQQIVRHLPGPWLAEPFERDYPCIATLQRVDGASIRVVIGGWRMDGRVEFVGLWPRFADGTVYQHGKRFKIACGATRPPATLAREIARRLLPAYDHEYTRALAYVTTHDANAAEAERVAERVASTLGARVGQNKSWRGDGVPILDEPECVRRLVVRPAYKDEDGSASIDFEVHGLDPETAAIVLHTIREAEERAKIRARSRVATSSEATEEEEEHEHETGRARARAR